MRIGNRTRVRMVPFSTTLSDLKPTFQGHDNIQRQMVQMVQDRAMATISN